MEPVDILLEARNNLNEDTWIKHAMRDGGKRFCALGHIRHVMGDHFSCLLTDEETAAIYALESQIPKHRKNPIDCITTFNDDDFTTLEMVQEAFDSAIRYLKDGIALE